MEASLRSSAEPVVEMVDDEPLPLTETAAPDPSSTDVAPVPAPRIGRDRRPIIYPLYLDKKKSVHEGRKVSQSVAVEEPTAQEIQEVCEELNLKAELEVCCASALGPRALSRAAVLNAATLHVARNPSRMRSLSR